VPPAPEPRRRSLRRDTIVNRTPWRQAVETTSTGGRNYPSPHLEVETIVVTLTADSAKRSVVGGDDREWVPFSERVAPESHRPRLRRGSAR
jgi:hypothetical protein